MGNLTESYGATHYTGRDCRVTNLRNILDFHGFKQSYSTVYGMSSGLDFAYRLDRSARDVLEHPHFNFSGLFHPTTGLSFNVIEQLAFNYGACIQGNYPDTPEGSWPRISGYLKQGLPVMLAVSHSMISLFLNRPDTFPECLNNVKFGGHWVTITALDQKRRTATLFETDRQEPFEIPLHVLNEARILGDDDDKCLMKSFARWVLFVPPPTLPSQRLLLRIALSKVLYNMTERVSDQSVHVGLCGLRRFAQDLPRWGEQAWDSEDFRDASAFLFCLNGESLSAGFGRKSFSSFLHRAAVSEGSVALHQASDEYLAAASSWQEIIASIKQVLATKDYSGLRFACSSVLEKVLQHETLACGHLEHYLKKGI